MLSDSIASDQQLFSMRVSGRNAHFAKCLVTTEKVVSVQRPCRRAVRRLQSESQADSDASSERPLTA